MSQRTITQSLDLIQQEFARDRADAAKCVQTLQDRFMAKEITLAEFNLRLSQLDQTIRLLAHWMKAEISAVTTDPTVIR